MEKYNFLLTSYQNFKPLFKSWAFPLTRTNTHELKTSALDNNVTLTSPFIHTLQVWTTVAPHNFPLIDTFNSTRHQSFQLVFATRTRLRISSLAFRKLLLWQACVYDSVKNYETWLLSELLANWHSYSDWQEFATNQGGHNFASVKRYQPQNTRLLIRWSRAIFTGICLKWPQQNKWGFWASFISWAHFKWRTTEIRWSQRDWMCIRS